MVGVVLGMMRIDILAKSLQSLQEAGSLQQGHSRQTKPKLVMGHAKVSSQ